MTILARFSLLRNVCLSSLLFAHSALAQSTEPAESDYVQVLTPEAPRASTAEKLTVVPSQDWAPYANLPIVKTEAVLKGEAWGNVTLPPILSVTPGEPFSPEIARRAIRELLATTRFARADVEVERKDAGVLLRVRVVARRVIESVRIDAGDAAFDQDELLRVGRLSENSELVGADLPEQLELMEKQLVWLGYPDAIINLRTEAGKDSIGTQLVLEVKAGDPRLIDRRIFYSSHPGLRTEDFAEIYKSDKGQRADESGLTSSDLKLQKHLQSIRYARAKVSHDVVKYRGQVILRVRVDAGPKTEFEFEGSTHFDDDTLRAVLSEAGDLSPAFLGEKIREHYRRRGFLDTVVTTTEDEGGESKDTRTIRFRIQERERAFVEQRVYSCFMPGEQQVDAAPASGADLKREFDSFLDEELPGAEFVRNGEAKVADQTLGGGAGHHPSPLRLDPTRVYIPDIYERAAEHVQELYRSDGYLHASVGPIQAIREKCEEQRDGTCRPLPMPIPKKACIYDASGVPAAVKTDASISDCSSEPGARVRCSGKVEIHIPVRIGPRTSLYDIAFRGNLLKSSADLGQLAGMKLGVPLNAVAAEEARRRIAEAYKDDGYAFVDVRSVIEESTDHSRARVHFDITEGERVIISKIVIKGSDRISASLVRKRISLEEGKPYYGTEVRNTLDYIGALGIFSSVDVQLADPYVPQKRKVVYVKVSEAQTSTWGTYSGRAGFALAEGVRTQHEYSNKLFFGGRMGLSARVQASYLPSGLVFDPQVQERFRALEDDRGLLPRIAGRANLHLDFPDIALGPRITLAVDGLGLQNLQRDFLLRKGAAFPTLTFRARQGLVFSVSSTVEFNDVFVFAGESVEEYTKQLQNPDQQRQLRVPDGASRAFAQRVTVVWDRRDNPFNPHSGTYYTAQAEHVSWTRIDDKAPDPARIDSGAFVQFRQTFSGYIPIAKGVTLAASLRFGFNGQLADRQTSKTYPDRLLFLGGSESMRGWLPDSLIPQDYVDLIEFDAAKGPADPLNPNDTRFTVDQVGIRGGDLMINPKVELRFPLFWLLESAVFADFGNVWADPTYPFRNGFKFRANVGTGIRFQTPVGPFLFDFGVPIGGRDFEFSGYPKIFGRFPYAFNFSLGLF
ncbi:MAG: BamA/TamA family outer membrane protein [Polyangiaceae bacterium]|nr:BamA/TamA family outer membrane protein [Polyangiaceae bacterium]